MEGFSQTMLQQICVQTMTTKVKREMDNIAVYMTETAVLNMLPTGSNETEEASVYDNQTSFNVTIPFLNSFYFYKVEQLTVLWILFSLIVVGNSAVLVTLYLNKRRKSRMNFFIMQLAAADLTVGLISVLTDIVWRITVTWHAGNFCCKLIRFFQVVVTYSSTYVLVALSIDRYDAITHPMNFSGSWRRARVLVLAAWLLSVLFSTPIFFLYEERLVQGKTQCWIEFQQPWQWQMYMTLVAMSLFVVPALIISGCYTVIVLTIWSKSKILAPSASRGVHLLQQDEHNCRRASSRGLIPRAKIKSVKMTFVIVFVFILCWSPYFVFDLLQVYGKVPETQTNIAVATFIQSLAPLNSAANPVIYCLFSTRMCNAVRRTPPISWLLAGFALCLPSLRSHNESIDTSSTVTVTLSQHSSRRSASLHTATSLRHVRLQAGYSKTAISAL